MSQAQTEQVAIYTMGKVASTTIAKSLQTHDIPCFDVHSLAPERYLALLRSIGTNTDFVQRAPQRPRLFWRNREEGRKMVMPGHLVDSLWVMQALIERRPIKLISLIREPVGRNISAAFQNMPQRLQNDPKAIFERLRKYPVNVPDRWFDEDFRVVTGLDLMDMDHDRDAAHFRFQADNLDILILKTASPDRVKSEILSDFLGQRIALTRANEANSKWYYRTYREWLAAPSKIRQAYLAECFALKYFRCFFSDEERQRVAEKFGYSGAIA
ncbi:putative capsular polysaccharide synthesis protein [Methyloligella halotolerans]|uniref:Putative capsular polysaccharide synthesis protein n=1 Tax=Methyloligella halotolerans TaxID=1177755 RepID=A0A1E2S2D6_9HYPH|nr:putative capsular polysaccharide synthesis family protein [Methyloligella halotolerans]ODA68673.1 putative capsular polysaccharide synthesis protein [Methyloligella halotolerans]